MAVDWYAFWDGLAKAFGGRGPDFVLMLLLIGGLLAIVVLGMRAWQQLQRRQDEREKISAEQDARHIEALRDMAAPLKELPHVLRSNSMAHTLAMQEQTSATRALREQIESGLRALNGEIMAMGVRAREEAQRSERAVLEALADTARQIGDYVRTTVRLLRGDSPQ